VVHSTPLPGDGAAWSVTEACALRWPAGPPFTSRRHCDGPWAPCRPRCGAWSPRRDYVSPAVLSASPPAPPRLAAVETATISSARRLIDLSSPLLTGVYGGESADARGRGCQPSGGREVQGLLSQLELSVTSGAANAGLLALTPKPAPGPVSPVMLFQNSLAAFADADSRNADLVCSSSTASTPAPITLPAEQSLASGTASPAPLRHGQIGVVTLQGKDMQKFWHCMPLQRQFTGACTRGVHCQRTQSAALVAVEAGPRHGPATADCGGPNGRSGWKHWLCRGPAPLA
jgi:hypothetical protein